MRNAAMSAQWNSATARLWRPGLFESTVTRGMAKSTLKTNKSASKRFRVRGNGQIVRYVCAQRSTTRHEHDGAFVSFSF